MDKEVTTTESGIPEDAIMPPLGVAQALIGTEIARLRQVAAKLERELANGGTNATGMAVPYLVDRVKEARAELESVKAEVDKLGALTGREAQVWAYRRGYQSFAPVSRWATM